MNLEDVIDPEYGLQQDEWSLSKPRFGDEGQLEVVGWSGSSASAGGKYYILKCSTCLKDKELFRDGIFKSLKGRLIRGKIPCGCSKKHLWSESQYVLRCKREAELYGYNFLGFVGEYSGNRTKIKISCGEHGEWLTCVVNLLAGHTGCPLCKRDSIAKARIKSDKAMIESFIQSGSFPSGTLFQRTNLKIKNSRSKYWKVYCPDCLTASYAYSGSLQAGNRSCACSKHRQKEAYINWIIDNNNMTTAIKFGVARDSTQRVKQQNSKSVCTVEQHSVYTFPDVASCKKAERECKQELECGVVLKRDMSDGWTETTWVHNLDKIIEIYERNGGVRNEEHSANSNYLLDSLPRTS